MPRSAPRLDPRLVAAIGKLDDRGRPLAETSRLVGELADAAGLPRPSYEQVRTLAHRARNGDRVYGWDDALIELSFRTRDPRRVLDLLIESGRVRPLLGK